MMELSQRKEQFSVSFLTAIAAQAGLNHSVPTVDEDSVDISLTGKGFSGKFRSPQIDIQLKCTSQDVISDGKIKYDLKLKNYTELRGENILVPRYLMILVVPDDPNEWITYDTDSIMLKHNCYWASLRFKPNTPNTRQVRIEIPCENKVIDKSLLDLMAMASKGEFV
jgi:hypothetical protein